MPSNARPRIDPAAIPYEILRRSDGAMALSCNAGLLKKPPRRITCRAGDGMLLDESGHVLALLKTLPDDLRAQLATNGEVRFYEFMESSLMSSSTLAVASEARGVAPGA